MKVKCIIPNQSGGKLIAGKIYEVELETDEYYVLMGCPRIPRISQISRTTGWAKDRFEVVETADGHKIMWSDAVVTAAIKQAPTSKKVDVEEEKCWQALRPKDPEGFCKCGTHRSVCWIHKDH